MADLTPPPPGPPTPPPPGPPVGPPPPQGPGPGGLPYQGPRDSSNAIVALILAIGSFVVCPIVLAIVALVLANKASQEIASSQGWVRGSGLVTAARVLAWINIGLAVAGILVALVLMPLTSH